MPCSVFKGTDQYLVVGGMLAPNAVVGWLLAGSVLAQWLYMHGAWSVRTAISTTQLNCMTYCYLCTYQLEGGTLVAPGRTAVQDPARSSPVLSACPS